VFQGEGVPEGQTDGSENMCIDDDDDDVDDDVCKQ